MHGIWQHYWDGEALQKSNAGMYFSAGMAFQQRVGQTARGLRVGQMPKEKIIIPRTWALWWFTV